MGWSHTAIQETFLCNPPKSLPPFPVSFSLQSLIPYLPALPPAKSETPFRAAFLTGSVTRCFLLKHNRVVEEEV